MILSILSLIVASLAFVLAIKNYVRTGKSEARKRHAEILDSALQLETTLKILQSNLLTTDISNHRPEVVDVVESALASLPALIAKTESFSEALQRSGELKQLHDQESSLRAIQARARTLTELLTHSLERGKIPDQT
ncbi:MAG: hypothetical protein ACRD9S_10465 [Pyrinomonadaceae bacterium]